MVIVPEKLIAEGDLVTIYWIARGTNTGTGNGLPATGKKVEQAGITIWRIVNGKIKEEWSAFDQLSMMQQLGLLPIKNQAALVRPMQLTRRRNETRTMNDKPKAKRPPKRWKRVVKWTIGAIFALLLLAFLAGFIAYWTID